MTDDLASRDAFAERIREIALLSSGTEDLAEALRNAEDARVMTYFLAAENRATHIRVLASRLECLCLRRVVQLGGADRIATANGKRRAAQAFAAMDDDTFARFLDDITTVAAPTTVYRMLLDREARSAAERETRLRFDYLFRDYGQNPQEDPGWEAGHERQQTIQEAALTLLRDDDFDGRAFAVSELAVRLSATLQVDRDVDAWGDPELIGLLGDAARKVMMSEPEVQIGDARLPRWVTVHDDVLGWVRIPHAIALLIHLKAHAALRHQQAEAAVERANQMTDLVGRLVGQLEEGEDDRTPIRTLASRVGATVSA